MRKHTIFTYFGLAILPALLVYHLWRRHQLAKSYSYTITETKKQISTLKNGLKITHVYYVDGITYNTDYSKNESLDIVYPGARYLVRFSNNRPSISEVLWDKPVPDSIRTAPQKGWRKMPF